MKSIKEEIKKTALETIKIETEAIRGLQKSINDDFVACVQHIFKCKGRVAITGIGKSAIIGNKIVATLNSTGTPSLFMHAADAIHGDMGMIQKNDIVICLSKSGETPELKVLIPLLKHTGNLLIAIVGNLHSYLAKQADYVLNATVSKEACPNNLAPTASTTTQLALGDALAMSLLHLKGFSTKDFAKIHPGGALGKQLYLKVDDIYINNQKPLVKFNADINTVILEISSKRLGATVVLDENKQITGIITDGDIRRMLKTKKTIEKLEAKDIMNTTPKIIQKGELAVNALQLMRQNNITQIIVMDKEKYLGMVHLHDLIKEGFV